MSKPVVGRTVTYAKTHANIFVGGSLGELGNTFPASGSKTFAVTMTLVEDGLLLKVNRFGKSADVFVPNSTVAYTVLAP